MALMRMVTAMEKEFKQLCERARWDLDLAIIARLADMKEVLSAFLKDEKYETTERDEKANYRGVKLLTPGLDLDRHSVQGLGQQYVTLTNVCGTENDKEFPAVYDGRPGRKLIFQVVSASKSSSQEGFSPSSDAGVLR